MLNGSGIIRAKALPHTMRQGLQASDLCSGDDRGVGVQNVVGVERLLDVP